MNMAAAAAADNPDGSKRDRVFRRQKRQQHFGFDLEMRRAQWQGRPGLQMNETEAGLGVGQMPSRVLR